MLLGPPLGPPLTQPAVRSWHLSPRFPPVQSATRQDAVWSSAGGVRKAGVWRTRGQRPTSSCHRPRESGCVLDPGLSCLQRWAAPFPHRCLGKARVRKVESAAVHPQFKREMSRAQRRAGSSQAEGSEGARGQEQQSRSRSGRVRLPLRRRRAQYLKRGKKCFLASWPLRTGTCQASVARTRERWPGQQEH